MITLGSAGEDLSLIVPVDAAFVATLTATDPWPDGAHIELHLMNETTDTPVIWAATISGVTAIFNVPISTVQAAVAARLSIARLLYIPSGSDALLWAHGSVRYV